MPESRRDARRSRGPKAPGSNSRTVPPSTGRAAVPQKIRSPGANSKRICRHDPQGGPASPRPVAPPARWSSWKRRCPWRTARNRAVRSAQPPVPSPGSGSSGATKIRPLVVRSAAPRGLEAWRVRERLASAAAARRAAERVAGVSSDNFPDLPLRRSPMHAVPRAASRGTPRFEPTPRPASTPA
jgi:hypothetical protein